MITATEIVDSQYVYELTPRDYDKPVKLVTLLKTLRDLRSLHGLASAKAIGSEFTPNPRPSSSTIEHHARLVGKRVVYVLDGERHSTIQSVVRAIRTKVRSYQFDDGEVLSASGLPVKVITDYLHGRLPEALSVTNVEILADTVDMTLAYELEGIEPIQTEQA